MAEGEWASLSEAIRETGVSKRTLDRLEAEKKIRVSRTLRGRHKRYFRSDLRKLLRESPASVPVSSMLAAKRESVDALALELQAERVKRELGKLRVEDAQAEQRRAEAQRAEALANKRALAEIHLQQRRDGEERKREKLAKQREDFRRRWTRWVSGGLPDWLSEYQVQAVSEAAERTLAACDLREPDAEVCRILQTAIARVLGPWQREREAWASRERLIEYAVRWRLPFFDTTDADKARAASAAREALSEVPLSASDTETRAVVDSAVAAIRREIEARTKAEEVRALSERERQRREFEERTEAARAEREGRQRESNKQVLLSVGVVHVGPYLRKLHAAGEVFDEDLARRTEMENAVRKALQEVLTGEETIETAQKIACEIVDKELE